MATAIDLVLLAVMFLLPLLTVELVTVMRKPQAPGVTDAQAGAGETNAPPSLRAEGTIPDGEEGHHGP